MCRSVKAIKALGCLAMIDDGELDWKVRHAGWKGARFKGGDVGFSHRYCCIMS